MSPRAKRATPRVNTRKRVGKAKAITSACSNMPSPRLHQVVVNIPPSPASYLSQGSNAIATEPAPPTECAIALLRITSRQNQETLFPNILETVVEQELAFNTTGHVGTAQSSESAIAASHNVVTSRQQNSSATATRNVGTAQSQHSSAAAMQISGPTQSQNSPVAATHIVGTAQSQVSSAAATRSVGTAQSQNSFNASINTPFAPSISDEVQLVSVPASVMQSLSFGAPRRNVRLNLARVVAAPNGAKPAYRPDQVNELRNFRYRNYKSILGKMDKFCLRSNSIMWAMHTYSGGSKILYAPSNTFIPVSSEIAATVKNSLLRTIVESEQNQTQLQTARLTTASAPTIFVTNDKLRIMAYFDLVYGTGNLLIDNFFRIFKSLVSKADAAILAAILSASNNVIKLPENGARQLFQIQRFCVYAFLAISPENFQNIIFESNLPTPAKTAILSAYTDLQKVISVQLDSNEVLQSI